MPDTVLAADFAKAVENARAHKGRSDYDRLVCDFLKLTAAIERSDGAGAGTPADIRRAFLQEADKKFRLAARGFAELLSFNGRIAPPRGTHNRSERIFETAVAGFLGIRGKQDQTYHFDRTPPSWTLRHLWIGLPRFMPADGALADKTPPPGASGVVRVNYEEFLQEGFGQLVAMAEKANVDLSFTYPNARTIYPGSSHGVRIPKAQRLDLRQDMGDAHVFPGALPVFSKILIDFNLSRPFDAGKYPSSYAALEQIRREQRRQAQAAEKAAAVSPAAPQTMDANEFLRWKKNVAAGRAA